MVQDAIARNVGVVLSLPSAGMLRHHKSRLLAEHDGGILLESPGDEDALIQALISNKQPCGVAFRKDHNKVLFASTLRARHPQWRLNSEDLTVNAVLLEFPVDVKTMQRRSNYRVLIPLDAEMSVRVWRIAERAYLGDRPMSAQEVKARLRDISIGGIGVFFHGTDGQPPKVTTDDRLRVALTFGSQTMLVEGRMRPPKGDATNGIVHAGIHFKNLEDTLEGRQNLAVLTRIVGELQRNEVRRFRLGMMQKSA